ncbi:MAG: zf-HC2 domain-containing protein [Microthrixaceae bacterium]
MADRSIEQQDDGALAAKARMGSRQAFDTLYARHAVPTWRLALAVSRHPGAAAAAVTHAFSVTLARSGDVSGVADAATRLALLRAARRAAIDEVGPSAIARPAHGTLDLGGADRRGTLVRGAFDTLPERWRSALWLVDVEGGTTADAAVVLEMAPAALASLLDRARLGLREQVLCAGLRRPSPASCRTTTDSLTGYARGSLGPTDEALVRTHLDGCAECRDRLGAIDDLIPVLASATFPPSITLVEEARGQWLSALVRTPGRLQLGLPGGRPRPAWAERAFAGSIAAVLALGVAAATMLASRDGNGRPALDVRPPVVAEAVDQEPLTIPPELSWDQISPFGTAARGPVSGGAGGTAGAPLPRSTTAPSAPLGGSAPGGPSLAPPPVTSPPVDPVDQGAASVVVDGVGGVVVGESCTGGELLGNGMGCEPAASDEPVSVGGTAVAPLTGG